MWVELAEAGAAAWQHRETIKETAFKLLNLLKHGNLHVLVLGSGGVGKTTLGLVLDGKDPEAAVDYQQSRNQEKVSLPGGLWGTAFVAAGQARLREVQWGAYKRQISNGDVALVIYVSSYGLHSFGEVGWRETSIAKQAGAKTVDQFAKVWAEAKREEEISVLRELVPHLQTVQGKLVFLSLITKQDLWWPDRVAVRDHYESKNGYGAVVDEIGKPLGNRFQHEILSTSLVESNFVDGLGEQILPTAAGYDRALQRTNLRKALTIITALLGGG